MKDHISVSQINLYLACSFKYRLTYIDEVPKPFKPAALAFGSAIHSALEWIHKQILQGKTMDEAKAIDIFEADWYAMAIDEIRYKNGETEKVLLEKGRNMIAVYLESRGDNSIRAVEMPFEVPLADVETGETLPIPLKGVIDLVEENDTIVDFKTAARAMSDEDLANNLQLTVYSYAYTHLTKREPALRFDVLFKTKEAKIEHLPTIRTQNDHRKLFFIAKEVLKSISSGVYYPNPSWRCTDCEYRSMCWMWQGKFPEES